MTHSMDIQPPLKVAGGATAPTGVCSRWMGDSPCGAAGSHHVIWNYEMTCGCVCPAHTDEIRQNWVYVGLHPYTAACASPGIGLWIEDEDRCVMPGDGEAVPIANEIALARTKPARVGRLHAMTCREPS